MQLGFDIDWSGIATNLAKGVASYQQNRDAIKLQMAQLQAQQAAQARAALPPSPYPTQPQTAVMPAPQFPANRTATYYAPRAAGVPTWAIAAGIGTLAVVGFSLLNRATKV